MKKRMNELLKALTELVDSITKKNLIESRIDEQRLKKIKARSKKWYFHLNDDDISWPDDFEEDWE
jgi:hypothetical protein